MVKIPSNSAYGRARFGLAYGRARRLALAPCGYPRLRPLDSRELVGIVLALAVLEGVVLAAPAPVES